MLTFEQVKNNDTIKTYISRADESLVALGFTEHSFARVVHGLLGALAHLRLKPCLVRE